MFKLLRSSLQFRPVFLLPFLILVWSCEKNIGEEVAQAMANTPPQDVPVVRHGKSSTIPNQYIIVFKENAKGLAPLTNRHSADFKELQFSPSDGRASVLKRETYEIQLQQVEKEISDKLARYHIKSSAIQRTITGSFHAAVVQLNTEELERVKRDSDIAYIEEDQLTSLIATPSTKLPMIPSYIKESPSTTLESVSYGIHKVGGFVNFAGNPVKAYRWAWILDSGIDMNHEDLDVDRTYSRNFTSDKSMDDQFGHGTHVAGIIAAKSNGKGVVGVAAGATVVSIKVMDRRGNARYSDIIAGLNYIYEFVMPGDVVNLSLGGQPSDALDQAVKQIAEKGVKVVIAAGNDQEDVSQFSPARINVPNVYTIGATNTLDLFASDFSNTGTGMDFLAPGVSILSTTQGNSYGYMTGTSMAAPHAAGVFLVAPHSFTSSKKCNVEHYYIDLISH